MEESFSSADYVLMPWDDKTSITVFQDRNIKKTYLRWELIQEQLKTSNISSVEDLVTVIKSYNVTFDTNKKQKSSSWKCLVLFKYFEELNQSEKKKFFEKDGVLSTIRTLSLYLREFVPRIKLLKTGTRSSVTFHQLQLASILSGAFFCIFPKGKADCPYINFSTLFEGPVGGIPSNFYTEKLKCFIHYFKRIHERRPSGYVSFHRLNIPDHKFPRWDETTASLSELVVRDKEKIEDKDGFLQMDFANKYIGGGVLGKGCVQEEIRFLISPELIAARLFTECLDDNESVFVVGAERYCSYTGYSSTFAFAGNYEDLTSHDDKKRKKTYLIILDALYFQYSSDQYRESKILRELKKAYVGFKTPDEFKNLPLATGNWGCGAFRGDPQLKFLLQLMASSQAYRPMWYLTPGDSLLKDHIMNIYVLLKNKAVNVGKLYCIIRLFKRERKPSQTLFDFIREELEKSQEEKFLSKFFYPETITPISKHLQFTSKSDTKYDLTEKHSIFVSTPSKEDESTEQLPEEETNENLSELNLDLTFLDKEIQEKSKIITTGKSRSFPSDFSPSVAKSKSPLEFSVIGKVMGNKNYCSEKRPKQEQSSGTSRSLIKNYTNTEVKVNEYPKKFCSDVGDFDPGTSKEKLGSPKEFPIPLELLMKQNEIDYINDKKVGKERLSDDAKRRERNYSHCSFSDDKMVNPQKKLDLESEISNSKANQSPPTFKCINNTRSAALYKSNKKKVIQRKITDSFYKK